MFIFIFPSIKVTCVLTRTLETTESRKDFKVLHNSTPIVNTLVPSSSLSVSFFVRYMYNIIYIIYI